MVYVYLKKVADTARFSLAQISAEYLSNMPRKTTVYKYLRHRNTEPYILETQVEIS